MAIVSTTDSASWQILPPTPLTNGFGQADAGSAVVGSDLYMIDGYGNTTSNTMNTVSIFHTVNDSWSSGPPAPIRAWNLACTSYLNQTIYCFYPGDNVFSYDANTTQWSVLPSVVPKDLGIGLGAVTYEDNIYLIGGYIISTIPSYTTNSVYGFSITNFTFTKLANTLVNFSGSVYSLYNGKIYALGGYSRLAHPPAGSRNPVAINSAEVYDIGLNTWSFLNTTLPASIYGAGREASAMNGLIPVVDGRSISYGVFFNSFYLYNITSNSWIQMPSTHFARDGISFWVLRNAIFVGDGRNSDSVPQGLPYLEKFVLSNFTSLGGPQTPPRTATTTTISIPPEGAFVVAKISFNSSVNSTATAAATSSTINSRTSTISFSKFSTTASASSPSSMPPEWRECFVLVTLMIITAGAGVLAWRRKYPDNTSQLSND